jgi:two-component system response regulator MprA
MTMRILVVDDDRAVRQSLRRSLAFNGYDVDVAADGVEALERAAEAAPHLIVLDVMMPRLGGLDACRELRARGLDTPVLMLTARDSASDRADGLAAGADAYLPKPFALDDLLGHIRALLDRTPVGA